MQSVSITIERRFRGPPESGNGGYVCGAFSELLRQDLASPWNAAEVTLRSPVPMDIPLQVQRANSVLTIHHGATLIAEGRLVELALEIPVPPSFDAAYKQRATSPSLTRNTSRRFPNGIGVHPECFCCGVQNGNGLEVCAAPVGGSDIVAAAWATKSAWGDAKGNLPERFIWTALDCPGQFAYYAIGIRTGMLGRLAARIVRPIRSGERCVVTGWRIGIERTKHFAGTAVFNEAGEVCAYANAIWIGRRDSPAQGSKPN